MFSFFKKSKEQLVTDFFPFTTDMHSHILPGIDDGSPDVETSIKLIKGLMALGVKKSIATPHVISDLYRNTPATIKNALSILQNELKNQNIQFEVSAAAEYMLDSYFIELLNEEERLLTLKDNIILTEFSYASAPDNYEKISFAIQMAGYKPILAHPERYPYFLNDFKTYNRLIDLGFMLQVNLLSLTGYYGKQTLKAAHYLLDNGLVSYIGSDMHHERHLMMLQDPKSLHQFHKYLSSRNWNDFS